MKHANKGFSLIELQIVMAVAGLLASILIPSVNNAKVSAGMTQTASNGMCIYLAAFDESACNFDGSPAFLPWPKEGDFASSTDLFKHLVTNDWLCVSYDFFAAPGIPAAKSNDPDDFKPENNAWKLVLGLDGARDGTPFLFTRNYAISAVPVNDGPITPDQLMDNGGKPFGTAGLVVVQKGGAALKLTRKSLTQQAFNPAGAPPYGHPLLVLAP